MRKSTKTKIGATLALAAGLTLLSVAPASAAMFGPYTSAAQCNADRTEYVRGGGSAIPCIRGVGGWYFQTY